MLFERNLKQGQYQYGNLFLINTEQERSINVGRDYGYDPLGDSECLLNQYQFTENGIEIGDTV